MSLDTKFYVHTNNNAPQLQNEYGCMIKVLDACLVTGFQVGVVYSMTAAARNVTVSFALPHNLEAYQIIEIKGSNQTEFNGQFRVLSIVDPNTFTFKLNVDPTVATPTGNLVCSLPPLGWEKPFQSTNNAGGGKAAYRSTDMTLIERPYLRVVDELDPAYNSTYGIYAKVGIVESMTNIDTMSGHVCPYNDDPNLNWVGNGQAKWIYSTSINEISTGNISIQSPPGPKSYIVVGNKTSFYIINKWNVLNNLFHHTYGFGTLKPVSQILREEYFLAAINTLTAATESIVPRLFTLTQINSNILLYRDASGASINTTAQPSGMSALIGSGSVNQMENPSAYYPVITSPYFLSESLGKRLRGEVPMLRWIYQTLPYNHLQSMTLDGKAYLAFNVASINAQGQVLIDLGTL